MCVGWPACGMDGCVLFFRKIVRFFVREGVMTVEKKSPCLVWHLIICALPILFVSSGLLSVYVLRCSSLLASHAFPPFLHPPFPLQQKPETLEVPFKTFSYGMELVCAFFSWYFSSFGRCVGEGEDCVCFVCFAGA